MDVPPSLFALLFAADVSHLLPSTRPLCGYVGISPAIPLSPCQVSQSPVLCLPSVDTRGLQRTVKWLYFISTPSW